MNLKLDKVLLVIIQETLLTHGNRIRLQFRPLSTNDIKAVLIELFECNHKALLNRERRNWAS